MTKCRRILNFRQDMNPIYSGSESSLSSKEDHNGKINEGFESEDSESKVVFQIKSIENDLSDQLSNRRKIDLSTNRSPSSKPNSSSSSEKNLKEVMAEESSKSNISGGTIMPDSITGGSKSSYKVSENPAAQIGKFEAMQIRIHNKCVQPFMYKYNVPPPESTTLQKIKYTIACPPHGTIEVALTWLITLFFVWACLVYIIFDNALPGGNIFSILVLAVIAQIVSMILGLIQVPPLLGMLLTGIIFKSVPGINVIGDSVDPAWASTLKSVALVVILIRAGLGLDPNALKKLSLVVLRLAFMPCLTEAFVDAVVSHYLLGFPWKWAFIQGFVIAAISPAVVVPCLLSLSGRGFGNRKGIPTLLIAGASIDDVVSITGFGIAVGMTFSTGSTVWQAVKGPLSAFMGVVYGIVVGIILWYIPNKNNSSCTIFRSILIFLAGVLVIFGSKGINYSGAGAIGCLVTTLVASIGQKRRPSPETNVMTSSMFFNHMWTVLAPIIFSLIGTEINVTKLDPDTIAWGILTLVIGLVCRFVVAFSVVMGAGFEIKERLFIALAWIPKATVQAAIGSTALDYARELNTNHEETTEEEMMGQKILTIAVLAILIAAPLGAAATMISGPYLLSNEPIVDEEEPLERELPVIDKEEKKVPLG